MNKNEPFQLEGTNHKGVLLCHTLAGDPSQMWELGKKLNKQGYHVSCPLYDGHGKTFLDVISTEVTDWYKNLVDAYNELSTKVDSVVVIGMSIGGTFAVKLAQEFEPSCLVTINAPIIGFDVINDVFAFSKTAPNKEIVKRYEEHRLRYFHFVTDVGQVENLRKITCPTFILQGSLDLDRYKTSSMMLMEYVNTDKKQRRDYAKSRHLMLLEADRKQIIKDILSFVEEI
jgi:carboxylesterase